MSQRFHRHYRGSVVGFKEHLVKTRGAVQSRKPSPWSGPVEDRAVAPGGRTPAPAESPGTLGREGPETSAEKRD